MIANFEKLLMLIKYFLVIEIIFNHSLERFFMKSESDLPDNESDPCYIGGSCHVRNGSGVSERSIIFYFQC